MIIALYVDDLLIAGNGTAAILSIKGGATQAVRDEGPRRKLKSVLDSKSPGIDLTALATLARPIH